MSRFFSGFFLGSCILYFFLGIFLGINYCTSFPRLEFYLGLGARTDTLKDQVLLPDFSRAGKDECLVLSEMSLKRTRDIALSLQD